MFCCIVFSHYNISLSHPAMSTTINPTSSCPRCGEQAYLSTDDYFTKNPQTLIPVEIWGVKIPNFIVEGQVASIHKVNWHCKLGTWCPGHKSGTCKLVHETGGKYPCVCGKNNKQ
jgi:hypothetical protein